MKDLKTGDVVPAIAAALLSASSFAGDYANVTQAPAACGVGWYFGVGGGANLYQDYGDSRDELVNGFRVHLDTDDGVGGFGGIKFGYVFGRGDWRWALEEDWFYNGVNARAHLNIDGVEFGDADATLNTAAASNLTCSAALAAGGVTPVRVITAASLSSSV